MTPRYGQSDNGADGRGGFTIAELIVGMVVAMIALHGIYEIFKHAMALHRETRMTWNSATTAAATADRIATTLEGAVNLPDIPSIRTRAAQEPETGQCLFCQTPTGRIRYRWFRPADGEPFVLERKQIPFAGTQNLLPGNPPEDPDDAEMWARVPARTLAAGLTGVRVQFKDLTKDDARWTGSWKGPVGQVAVRVKISLETQSSERVVIPRATATIHGQATG